MIGLSEDLSVNVESAENLLKAGVQRNTIVILVSKYVMLKDIEDA